MARAGSGTRFVYSLIGWPVLLNLALSLGWWFAHLIETRCTSTPLATNARDAFDNFVSLVATVLVGVAVGAVTAADRVIQKKKLFPRQTRTLPSGSDLGYRLTRVAQDFDASARWLRNSIDETGKQLLSALSDPEFEHWLTTEAAHPRPDYIGRAREIHSRARHLQDLIALPQHSVPAEQHRGDLVYALRTFEEAAHAAIIHVDGDDVLKRARRLLYVSPEIAIVIVLWAFVPRPIQPWLPLLPASPDWSCAVDTWPVVLSFYVFCVSATARCAIVLRRVFFEAVNL